MAEAGAPDIVIGRIKRAGLLAAAAGGALLVVGAFADPRSFFRAYLIAFVFWLGISLGSLAFLMLHHLTGGRWGFVVRRLLEAAAITTPVMAVLFVPLLFGFEELYPWARAAAHHDPVLEHKAPYLNVPFFIGRAVFYFVVWTALAVILSRWSSQDDRADEAPSGHRYRMLCGPGLAVWVLTVSFAAIDWMMSLEPHWFSTAYPLIVLIGQIISALAFAILGLALLAKEGALAEAAEKLHIHDLGNFLMAFILLWAYISFSQFLIIWYGNLSEEAPWIVSRTGSSWAAVALGLVVFHFAAPFFTLLNRRVKRDIRILARVAVVVLFMRIVDDFWLITPALERDGLGISWLDIVAPLALGGVWLFFVGRALGRQSLVPRHHPVLEEYEAHV